MKKPRRTKITDEDRLNWLSRTSRDREVTFFHPPGNESVRDAIDRQIKAERAKGAAAK